MTEILVNRLDGRGLEPQIFVGDIDTALILRLLDLSSDVFNPLTDPSPPPLDISSATPATDLSMRFRKQDGTIVTKVATFATETGLPGFTGTGTDGYIEYRTEVAFLDLAGRWRHQALVTLGVASFASEIVDFEVFARL